MQLIRLLGTIPGFDVREQKIGNETAISITGPAKAIGYGLQFALFVGLIAIAQVARYGIRKDGQNAHLVLMANPQYQIAKKDEHALAMLEGYHYAHQVTAMDKGVNAAVFDEGFTPDENTGKAFGQFAAAIFEKGIVRGTDTNTLLLLGRSAKDRVLVACQWGKQNPLRVIGQLLTGDVRYASSQGNTILASLYGTNRVAALYVEEIVAMFADGIVPTWKDAVLGEIAIEDMTPSFGDQPTVVLTATTEGGKKRKLIPANVRWGEEKGQPTFALTLATAYAADLPQDKGPVVRLTETTVTMVDSNGRDTPRLSVQRLTDFGSKNASHLRQMAEAAASGQIYQAAA